MNTHHSSHTIRFLTISPYFMVYALNLVDLSITRFLRRYWGVLDHHLLLSEQILPSSKRQPTPWTEDNIEQTTIHTHTHQFAYPRIYVFGLWEEARAAGLRGIWTPDIFAVRRNTAPFFLFRITKVLGPWAEPGIPAQNTQAWVEHANHCTPEKLTAADLYVQSLCKPEFIPAAGCVLCHHLSH